MPSICIMIKNLLKPDCIPLSVSLQAYLDNELEFSVLSDKTESVYLCLVDESTHAPYRVLSPEHIILSTAKAASISTYAGLSLDEYMKLCLALALVQRQALCMNPLLKSEDMIHMAHEPCLFNRNLGIENFALHLEHKLVCGGCRDFYHCLGCDREMLNLQREIDKYPDITLQKNEA